MKRSKLILFGSVGIAAVAALFIATPYAFNKKGAYQKNNLSFVEEQTAEDAMKWLEARYFDPETGEKMTPEKLALIDKALKSARVDKTTNLTWREEGPDNIGGRTRAILVDRTNNDRVWAGSVSGGLFVTTNRANQWNKVVEYPGSKFISSMTQTSNGTIFVATGSANEGFNGNGVHYSSDFGTTWNVVPGTAALPEITEVVSSDAGNTIWMATGSGVKKWSIGDAALTDISITPGVCRAIQISKDGQVIVASVGSQKTFVSTDGGDSFDDKSGSTAGKVPLGSPRIEYAISPSKNSANKYSIYAVRTNSNLLSMHVSHDNGQNWDQFVGASGTPSNLDIYRNQGTYNSIVAVRPNDPESILIGGIDVWKWKQQVNNPPSGGFEKLSQWFVNPTSPSYVHADNHEMKFDALNRLYMGNDGGIGVTNNFGVSWYPANRGYNVTQFYGIAFDNNGSVMGGAQDNGTLYNNHSFASYKEFIEVGGGDGFECEISFFNPKVMFSTIYYNSVLRSGDGGASFGPFSPSYPASYGAVGSTTNPGPNFPFHTEIFLAENYDLNSKDSVTFIPSKNYSPNSKIRVPSLSTGDTISYVTPTGLYYNDTVNYKASLTQNRVSVVNSINGQTVLLGNYSYTPFATASGQNPPLVGDSLLVNFPTGNDTVVVQSTGTYKYYFAQHPISNKVVELGLDSVRYNFAWDTVRVQDPFQSWFVVYTTANGGELWGTRDALRLSIANPRWLLIAKNLGGNGNTLDIEFSRDLNSLFVSSNTRVSRVDGLGAIYTSDANFATKAGYSGPTFGTAPTTTTQTVVSSTGAQGIALNPNNPNDLMLLLGTAPAKRSNNAASGSPTFTTLSPLTTASPFAYDAIIDRNDPDLLVVGTSSGVFTSDDGGATWSFNSEGFEGTPVYEVRQSWRSFSEGNNRPGEIYIGTFGRGIWASSSVLGLSDNGSSNKATSQKVKLKTYPNPTATSTTLSFVLAEVSDVTVNVYSITGSLVKTVNVKNMNAGENDLNLDVNNLPKGTYIVKLVAGTKTDTAKFIKL